MSRRHASSRARTKRGGRRATIGAARFGLVAHSLFYCLLVYLVAQLAVDGGGGRQANAHGALTTIANNVLGRIALGATAVGFMAVGVTQVWTAIRDRAERRVRVAAAVRGLFYVAIAWLPASYAMGRQSAGSEQQQHRTASGILSLPAGRQILFTLGLVIVVVCLNQIRIGVDQDYQKGMRTRSAPHWVKVLVKLSGTIGIPARALVFGPLGIFFMIAAVQSDSRHADGLDAELATLARHSWGVVLLALVAAGLAVFAVYSFLEARYRTMDA